MISCAQCKSLFSPKRKDKIFCSKTCVYKHYNDSRPRKTAKSYIKAEEKRTTHIPEDQLGVIKGCLLGDASLILQSNTFHRLSLCHSGKQEEYIEFKRRILSSIFLQKKCNVYTRKDTGQKQFHCHSISHKDLTNLYGQLYAKRKVIRRNFLNTLTTDSLLFWFLDDGSTIKASGYAAILCTDSFSLSEVQTIKIWLWQKYRISTKISESRGSFNSNVYYRIRFNKAETVKFFNVLSTSSFWKELPTSMMYKFHPYF